MAVQKLVSCLLVVLVVSLTMVGVSEGAVHPGVRSVSNAASTGMIPFNVQAWLQLLRSKISQLQKAVEGSKRSCNGFPCMYTHLGAKAGKQARMMSLLSILNNCARDPSCSPGKRRRRSATAQAVLSMLTNQKTTS
ncbi:hypothetical protein ACOMHN_027376 [Nucella lapillus]